MEVSQKQDFHKEYLNTSLFWNSVIQKFSVFDIFCYKYIASQRISTITFQFDRLRQLSNGIINFKRRRYTLWICVNDGGSNNLKLIQNQFRDMAYPGMIRNH